jgi:hypothetical protein
MLASREKMFKTEDKVETRETEEAEMLAVRELDELAMKIIEGKIELKKFNYRVERSDTFPPSGYAVNPTQVFEVYYED